MAKKQEDFVSENDVQDKIHLQIQDPNIHYYNERKEHQLESMNLIEINSNIYFY